jgi:4-carboxymuconolactone decarboxylase
MENTGDEESRMSNKIPGPYIRLKQAYPDFIGAYEQLGEAAKKSGPLSEKQAQLIQLAGAAAIRSEGSVHSHCRRAIEAGATADEIRHALMLLVSTAGFSTMVAALTWVEDIIVQSEQP